MMPTIRKRSAVTHDAVLFIDMGGDKAMYHKSRARAKELGRPFRYFSLDAERSHSFDPFQMIGQTHRIIRLCNLFLEAFSLDHGIVYGGSWFSQRNLLMLLAICEEMVAQKKDGREITLQEVDHYLSGPKCANIKDAEQVRGIFRFLLAYEQLQPKSSDPDLICLKRCIERGEVVYAFLPAISEATTSRQIAGLFLQVAVASAMKIYEEREGSSRPQPHIHIFCDEFANIAGASFESLLTGARKYGVSLYMAYQTTESLQKDKATDLAPAVRDNSVLKMLFTVTGYRDIEELKTFSREDTRPFRSSQKDVSVRLNGVGAFGRDSESEQLTTQLSKNEVLDISARKGAFLAIIDDGLGHREPIPGMGSYAMSKAEYLKFLATPLPLARKRRGRLNDSDASSPKLPRWEETHLSSKKTKVHRERLSRIAALLDELDAKEQIGF